MCPTTIFRHNVITFVDGIAFLVFNSFDGHDADLLSGVKIENSPFLSNFPGRCIIFPFILS